MLDQTTNLASLLKDPSLLETRAYVNGAWIDGDDGTFAVDNPARGDTIADVADLSRAQVAAAIAAAEKAQKEWAKWTGKERAGVLRKWFDLMMEHQDHPKRGIAISVSEKSNSCRCPSCMPRTDKARGAVEQSTNQSS